LKNRIHNANIKREESRGKYLEFISVEIPKRVDGEGIKHYRNPKTLALSSKIPA